MGEQKRGKVGQGEEEDLITGWRGPSPSTAGYRSTHKLQARDEWGGPRGPTLPI